MWLAKRNDRSKSSSPAEDVFVREQGKLDASGIMAEGYRVARAALPRSIVVNGTPHPLTSRAYGYAPDLAWHGSVGRASERSSAHAGDPDAWTTLIDDGNVEVSDWDRTRATVNIMTAEFYVPGVTTAQSYPHDLLRAGFVYFPAPAGSTSIAIPGDARWVEAKIEKDDNHGGFGPYDNNFRVYVALDPLVAEMNASRRGEQDARWLGYLAYSTDGGASWAWIGRDNQADGGRPLELVRRD